MQMLFVANILTAIGAFILTCSAVGRGDTVLAVAGCWAFAICLVNACALFLSARRTD